MEKGMVDVVVHRKDLKRKIEDILDFLIDWTSGGQVN